MWFTVLFAFGGWRSSGFVAAATVALMVFALIAIELAASGWTIALSALFLVVLGIAFTRYMLSPAAEPDMVVDPLNARYDVDAHPDD